jgi:glycosyltransferase involved in cell wall biosynthesis
LRLRGIESRVLFFTFDREEGLTVRALRQQGFDCEAILWPQYTEDRVRWILERLCDDPPDIFVPNLSPPACFAGRWVREAGIPTIGVLHADNNFGKGLVREFVVGQRAFRLSALVCVSQFLEREVRAKSPNGMPIRHIPCGVPLPDHVVQYPKGSLRLLYVGRLTEEYKQISQLTRAMCRAVREVPGTEGMLIGDGSARLAVEQILREQGMGSAVRLVGRLDSGQIQEAMLQGHIIVLLSDSEGLPIALMEAMACGLVPVCLSTPSGIPELVEDGVTGLIVNDRADNFVAAIRQLQMEPGLWQRLSSTARARIESGYSVDEGVTRWVQLMGTVLQTTKGRASIRIPRRFDLPAVNPALATEDNRMPPFYRQLIHRSQRLSGALIRRLSRA